MPIKFFERLNSFLYGMLGALTVLVLAHCITKPNKEIATVNITGIVDQYIKQESKANVQPDVLQHNIKEFGKKLEMNLKELSQKKHLILLPSEAVIAGSDDYTNFIIKAMD